MGLLLGRGNRAHFGIISHHRRKFRGRQRPVELWGVSTEEVLARPAVSLVFAETFFWEHNSSVTSLETGAAPQLD